MPVGSILVGQTVAIAQSQRARPAALTVVMVWIWDVRVGIGMRDCCRCECQHRGRYAHNECLHVSEALKGHRKVTAQVQNCHRVPYIGDNSSLRKR